jgi:hypothetical protein
MFDFEMLQQYFRKKNFITHIKQMCLTVRLRILSELLGQAHYSMAACIAYWTNQCRGHILPR